MYFCNPFANFIHLLVDKNQAFTIFEDNCIALNFVFAFLNLMCLVIIESLIFAAPGVVVDISGSERFTSGRLDLALGPEFAIHSHSNNSP